MDVIIKNRYKIIEKIKDKSKCSIYKGFDLIEKYAEIFNEYFNIGNNFTIIFIVYNYIYRNFNC